MSGSTRRSTPDQIAAVPDLDPGITLCNDTDSIDNVVHALAVDHVLLSGGTGIWIDPGTRARTDPLTDLAPSARILDQIRVARGFTPFQHLALLQKLPDWLTAETSLVVVPEIDRYYRDDSLLADEGEEMLLTGVVSLARIARRADVAALVTRSRADEFSAPVERAADQRVRCEQTPFGPRFQTPEEETLVYPVEGGEVVQTTLAFWADVLASREPLYETPGDTPEDRLGVSIRGSN
ncbi:hypothetical protein GRX03_04185 [Halovenus sp. WSH3]|uniref:DNA recombination and repair protein Rad51-like C-terminal domain-containing protein n=1 Tax=Halovenus carboxidivorans TaxID=2692199 RepID=A0A6B0SZ95_9EURY|nr:hypothetical protein [Halovenus carboxidivorans]MXR50805.1 hypothetical protein [Halovenus carboxidivorans]